jgi:hypothetical protein
MTTVDTSRLLSRVSNTLSFLHIVSLLMTSLEALLEGDNKQANATPPEFAWKD